MFNLGNQISQWTEEERLEAERVCQSYDTAGTMVRHGMLPKDIVIGAWTDSLIRSWEAARPLVEQHREERKAPEFWDNFEWLARQAKHRTRK